MRSHEGGLQGTLLKAQAVNPTVPQRLRNTGNKSEENLEPPCRLSDSKQVVARFLASFPDFGQQEIQIRRLLERGVHRFVWSGCFIYMNFTRADQTGAQRAWELPAVPAETSITSASSKLRGESQADRVTKPRA